MFLVAAGCIVGCFAQQQNKDAVTEVAEYSNNDKDTWDFGEIKVGSRISHEFILENQTQDELKIKNVSTSCGCTVAEVKKKILAPGEKTTIFVEFDSTGYTGRVMRYVYVSLDDKEQTLLKYTLQGKVK